MTELIVGRNAVVEALKAGRSINKIFISNNIERHAVVAEIIHLAKQKGIIVEYIEKRYLDNVSKNVPHQGVSATASPKKYTDVDDLIDEAKQKGQEPFLVILDGIEDPRNLGAIIRTCDASGVHGVIIPKRRAVQVTETVDKTSAGAVEHMAIARVTNINNTLDDLKEKGFWITGLSEDAEKNYTELDYKGPIAIVVGGEGNGISHLTKEKCDFLAKIPMKGKISSLNASVAAAIVFYEVVRQRSV